jgi:mannosyltransferase OCH1-like enzyme
MIPKVIHYVWLGGKQKHKNFEEVIASWNVHASAFELQEWTEEDAKEFDLPEYYYRCLKERKWAFASDVLRFHILFKYGGIYLDVDEVLLKNIETSELLDNQFFLSSYHEVDNYFGFGFVGGEKGSEFSKRMVEFYDAYSDEKDVIINAAGSPIALTLQKENNAMITIFPQHYFYPLTSSDITGETYGRHLSNTSWIPAWKKALHKIPFYFKIKTALFKVIPKRITRKLSKTLY